MYTSAQILEKVEQALGSLPYEPRAHADGL